MAEGRGDREADGEVSKDIWLGWPEIYEKEETRVTPN